jgi:hypothetical protein
MVFGTSLLERLSEPEMMVLARHGTAVSPVTSFLAIEPGVRPSTEGLDWSGGGGGGGIGLGSIGTLGYGAGIGPASLDRQRHLEGLVAEQLATCGGAGRSLTLELETTRHEIVDVSRVDLKGAPDLNLEGCLREGIWAFALPRAFTSESASFTIRI